MDYKSMDLSLFNSITSAIEILQTAQRKAEESYINDKNEELLKIIKSPPDTSKAAK